MVAELWRKILGVELVGANDPFLELGGDSISAMRFISEIADVAGVDLSIESLFSNSTVREVAATVDQKMSRHSA